MDDEGSQGAQNEKAPAGGARSGTTWGASNAPGEVPPTGAGGNNSDPVGATEGATNASGGSTPGTGGETATGGTNSGPSDGEPARGVGTAGWAVGDHVPNFAVFNQDGEEVRMNDYCGKVVWLDLGAAWCGACQFIAEEWVEPFCQERKHRSFDVLTLLTEDVRGNVADTATLKAWQDTYGLTTDVAADPNWEIINSFLLAAGRDPKTYSLVRSHPS